MASRPAQVHRHAGRRKTGVDLFDARDRPIRKRVEVGRGRFQVDRVLIDAAEIDLARADDDGVKLLAGERHVYIDRAAENAGLDIDDRRGDERRNVYRPFHDDVKHIRAAAEIDNIETRPLRRRHRHDVVVVRAGKRRHDRGPSAVRVTGGVGSRVVILANCPHEAGQLSAEAIIPHRICFLRIWSRPQELATLPLLVHDLVRKSTTFCCAALQTGCAGPFQPRTRSTPMR